MLACVDEDGDEFIQFSEFVQMLRMDRKDAALDKIKEGLYAVPPSHIPAALLLWLLPPLLMLRLALLVLLTTALLLLLWLVVLTLLPLHCW